MSPFLQKERIVFSFLLMITSVVLFSPFAFAQYPSTISYQGFLEREGVPYDSLATISFRIGQWTETHPDVRVNEGRYSVQLGSINPIPTRIFSSPNPPQFIQVSVNGNTLSPNVSFSTVPYAHSVMDSSINTLKIQDNSILPRDIRSTGNNKVLVTDNTGRVVWRDRSSALPDNDWQEVGSNIIRTSGNVLLSPTSSLAIGMSADSARLNVSGDVYLRNTPTPSFAENRLYATGGDLFWNGNQLNSSANPLAGNGLEQPVDSINIGGFMSSNIILNKNNNDFNIIGRGRFSAESDSSLLRVYRDSISIRSQGLVGKINLQTEGLGGNINLVNRSFGGGTLIQNVALGNIDLENLVGGNINLSNGAAGNIKLSNNLGGSIVLQNSLVDSLSIRNGRIMMNSNRLLFNNTTNQRFSVIGGSGSLTHGLRIDSLNNFGGVHSNTAPILHFGNISSQVGIGSNRTGSDNQNGLDFYTSGTPNLSISPDRGKIGIGTRNPLFRLHIVREYQPSDPTDENTIAFDLAANAGTDFSSLMFRRSFAGQTALTSGGVKYGELSFFGYNGSNYLPAATISVESDNPSVVRMPSIMTFNVTPNGTLSSSPTEVMRIFHNGPLGGGRVDITGILRVNGTPVLISDIRYKSNIKILPNSLDKVKQIRGVSYNWKRGEFPKKQFTNQKQIGVIAQEVEAVYPGLVYTDENGYKSVNYAQLTAVLIEAIKEQQSQIDALRAKLNKTQKENSNLKVRYDERLESLESQISDLIAMMSLSTEMNSKDSD